MCFSASASFSASGVLGVVGAASLAKADKDQRMYAAIPLIFAVQQAIEGVVWVSPSEGLCKQNSGLAFLFIAYVVWPVYVPVSVYLMEKNAKDRKRILPFIMLGSIVSLFLLAVLVTRPIMVVNSERHIRYLFDFPFYLTVGACYVLATCGSLLSSSHRYVRVVGLATALALGAAYILAKTSVGSVWCFFAAVLSVLIYAHIHETRFQSGKNRPA